MLSTRKTKVREERLTTRAPLSEEDVLALLGTVETVWIVRGKRVDRRPASEVSPADLKGPTGSFRAPILRRGKRLLVGSQAEALAELLD
ncbi:MAG: hypothetical protein GX178_02530 [Acidobacteria bacterium]|nr:hypothetical protein [Thermoanaerobaculia bacterium]MDI9631561.1 hypothetical protein [Acidobacteriota bacterium]OQC39422.1 MAG: hypothetical protein BWX64_01642 [Acidobacteria bacterium ADurb.Bin051]MBP7812788.1 hypothetical protein [Thermoanaerobaculia bacterium]MBP8845532.1 hypothetical protein [Thermoanaerobaculia bacterium]